jgi:hypothetical protein
MRRASSSLLYAEMVLRVQDLLAFGGRLEAEEVGLEALYLGQRDARGLAHPVQRPFLGR